MKGRRFTDTTACDPVPGVKDDRKGCGAGLRKLVNLNLHTNRISDISPAAGLTNLEIADWHNNRITDVAPISDLSRLVHLHLADRRRTSRACSLGSEREQSPLGDRHT